MKPIDHPEFFRLPPPPGQSRESSIRLDAEGRFWHGGERVVHPGMQRAFASWIRRHPDDGRFILCNGYDWSYFTVEDAPFFVCGVRPSADGISSSLSDQSEEPLVPANLRVGARDALYQRIKGGEFEARFTPSAQTALLPWLEEQEDGQIGLRLLGRLHRIGSGR
jgi:hypothetical protein